MAPVDSASGPRIVVLAGPGDSTNIVVHYLAARYGDVVVVQERPQSRWTLARRRARRLGWVTVTGQVLFVAVVMPVLRRRGRARIASVLAESQLDPSPVGAVRSVSSVNAPEAAALLGSLHPDVVVVNGTRIIGAATLNAIACPVVNVHAGITPRYRGVHGGYWALAEGRPDLVGTTVHLVDTGIDTGRVLDRGFFHPGPADSIATYPYLHLACGLPLLAGVVDRLIGTDAASPGQAGTGEAEPGESTLRWHPTVWGYVWRRMRRGVR